MRAFLKNLSDPEIIDRLRDLSRATARKVKAMKPTKSSEYENMNDQEFFEFLSDVLTTAHARILRIKNERGVKTRAKRKSNAISLKNAVRALLDRHEKLKLNEISRLIVSELKYVTESTGDKWQRSVYQSGISPLLKESVIKKDADGCYFLTGRK